MFIWRSGIGEIWIFFLFQASMVVLKRRREE
jgi:hypothetical protein